MKFVIATSFSKVEQLGPLAIAAEEAGYEMLAFSDHVVHPEKIDAPYPYTEDGQRRWEAFTDWPEPWVTIGYLAGQTSRIRFTTNVFVLAMRNPFIAAKMIGTAAVLSNDRVTLTLGVGWSDTEFRLMGQEFARRGKRTDEMIDILRTVWTGDMVEHHGEFYDFDRIEMNPAPRQRIPIWIGGFSDPALRRAARQDGWLSDLQSTDDIAKCIDKVRHFRAEQGRPGERFEVMASASDAFDLAGYQRLEELGVTHIMTMPWMLYGGPTNDLQRKLDGTRQFADDVIHRMA
jgi:probable F420-dependent oxidoreductase